MYDKMSGLSLSCDLCGQQPQEGEIFPTEELMIICPSCRQKLEEMPERAKEKLINYLIGNVL